jgi:hypothetical protein
MPILQLFVVALVAMIGLAAMRLVRVHLGRSPHPGGIARLSFILAFLLLPPIALGLLTQPAGGPLVGIAWVPVYVAMLATLGIVMWLAAAVVRTSAPRRSRPLLVLALVASQDEAGPRFDPPLTAKLAESQAVVDTANAVFPRGVDFPTQIGRAGFRPAWDALDAATRTLEGRIADDEGRGVGVAAAATATAEDARGRLETLRGLAADGGQGWAKA